MLRRGREEISKAVQSAYGVIQEGLSSHRDVCCPCRSLSRTRKKYRKEARVLKKKRTSEVGFMCFSNRLTRADDGNATQDQQEEKFHHADWMSSTDLDCSKDAVYPAILARSAPPREILAPLTILVNPNRHVAGPTIYRGTWSRQITFHYPENIRYQFLSSLEIGDTQTGLTRSIVLQAYILIPHLKAAIARSFNPGTVFTA